MPFLVSVNMVSWSDICPPCTCPFGRSCSLPQTFFSPCGWYEALAQEGAAFVWKESPHLFSAVIPWKKQPRTQDEILPPQNILLVLTPIFHNIPVSSHLYGQMSFENCLRRTSLMWKENKVNTFRHLWVSVVSVGAFWQQSGLKMMGFPQEDHGLLFPRSECWSCFLAKGWLRRRYPRKALLLIQATLVLLTVSCHLPLLSKTCDWWHPEGQLLLKKPHVYLMSSLLPKAWREITLWINDQILPTSP